MHKFQSAGLENKYETQKSFRMRGPRSNEIRNFHITLKQWKTLHAVIDCGGFANAAEHLHISQSAISYTIAKLEEQLGISVLKIEGRKAQLTVAGRELLDRSRHLINDAAELEIFAENLRKGWDSEVRLAISQDFPTGILMRALRRFAPHGGNVLISLKEASVTETEKALFERTADLVICSCMPFGFNSSPLVEIESVAVARADSQLFKLGREINSPDLERHIQIVIGENQDNHYRGHSRPPAYSQQWSVCNFETAIAAVCEGMGYAWLPKHRVEKFLKRGEISVLPLKHGSTYITSLYLVHGRTSKPGSSISVFAEFLQNAAEEQDEPSKLLTSVG